MGMFDSISNAASAASKPLDTLSNMLGGNTGDGATNADESGRPLWWHGYNLDVAETEEETGGHAPNLENTLDSYPVIEFIHFGWVHTSHSHYFTHDDLSGTNANASGNAKIKKANRPRGIQFRSALEREALLLWLFMLSTQQVLKKKEDDSKMGGLGAALDVASSLFGQNKAGGGQTRSSELTSYMAKVLAAIQPVLAGSIVYKDIHKAGVDLHQARADYRQLLDKIIKEEPAAGKGGIAGDLMSQAASLPSTIMGGAGDSDAGGNMASTLAGLVSLTQGIVFKAQDVVAKLYAYTARQQEPQIENACNEMTYQGIHQTMNPFFPIWFTPAEPAAANAWSGPADPLANKDFGNVGNLVKSSMQGVNDGLRSGFAQSVNSVKGFFEPPPDTSPPGTEALGMAFFDPPKHRGAKSLVPMKMGSVAFQAFSTVLKLPSLGFAETVISGVMGVVLDFTNRLYQSLLVRDPESKIETDALIQSAADDLRLASRLEGIAREKLSFLNDIRNWDVAKYTKGNALLDGFSMKPGAGLMDRGTGYLDELIASKVSPLLAPIIEYAMANIAAPLEAARGQGVEDNCHTMEWYLGWLPKIQATLFGDLFFPFYTQLMKAGAEVVGGPVGSALKGVLAMADKMKGQVDSVRDKVARAGSYVKDAQKTVDELQSIENKQFLDKPKEAYQRFRDDQTTAAADTPSTLPDTPEQQALADHPLTSRVDSGQGVKIALADYKAMVAANVFKWDDVDARDPDASNDGSNRATV